MSEISFSASTRATFNAMSIDSDSNSIYPRLRLNIDVSQFTSLPNSKVTLSNIFGKAYIVTKDNRNVYVGDIIADVPYTTIFGSTKATLSFYLTTDYFGLSQIERIREGSDLNFKFEIRFMFRVEQPSQQESVSSVWVDYKISKSDWVEKLLTELKYKEIFLLEIPKLGNENFIKVIQYLDESWKQLAMGEYSNVLINCQKSLEEAKSVMKNKGLLKINESSGDKKEEIDFSKLIDSDNAKEALDSIHRKLFLFFQPGGRHIGRTINKEDAEFAILVTYGLINILIKKS